jgi:glycosyltransferase involved in cell wall biosynthesis
MKILQLISSAGFFGAESVVLQLSRELNSLRVKNVIGGFDNSQNHHTEIAWHAEKYNLDVAVFKCGGKIDVKTLFDIKKFVKDNEIDIIHTHGYKSDVYGFMAGYLLKKPLMSTCHNWISDDLRTRAYYRLDKTILRRFHRVVAVSEDIETELLRNRISRNKISLIFNGIDTSKFGDGSGNIRREFNIDDSTKVIGTVARFTAEKGMPYLLEAAKELLNSFPDIVFMIVGDGPLKNDLAKKSIDLGISERVVFTGMRDDMPEVYSAMDIFVLPSLKEGLPMVLLEAMSAGKPVVATSVGAVTRVIENGKEGLLVSPGDANELKRAITLMLTDGEFSRQVSRNAYNRVSGNFSSKAMCSRYLEIYETLVKN